MSSLTPGGAADILLNQAKAGRFLYVLAEDIVAETAQVLLERPHIQYPYPYTDADVQAYLQGLRQGLASLGSLRQRGGILPRITKSVRHHIK